MEIDTPLLTWIEANYFPRCLPGNTHEESRKEHRIAARNLGRALERVATLRDLNDATIAVLVNWMLSRKRSPATANKTVRHLKAVARFAREDCHLKLKALRPRPLKEPKREPEAWSTDELAKIARAASKRGGMIGDVPAALWWEAMVLSLMSTGLRVTALLRAPTDGYDRHRGELMAAAEDQKQRADQRMELLPSAVAAIERLAPWDRHLPTIFGDWRMCESTLRRSLRLLLVESGLFASVDAIPPHRNAFHKFRRSFATQVAASAGRDAARELLGHSSPTVTDRYIDRRYVSKPSIATLINDPVTPRDPAPATLRLFAPASEAVG